MRDPSRSPSPERWREDASADASVSPSPDAPSLPFVEARDGLVGYRVMSGSGEDLGVVVGIELDRFGRPKKLAFIEDGAREPRYVPLRYVRSVQGRAVRLAGPREGYHITRVMRDPTTESD